MNIFTEVLDFQIANPVFTWIAIAVFFITTLLTAVFGRGRNRVFSLSPILAYIGLILLDPLVGTLARGLSAANVFTIVILAILAFCSVLFCVSASKTFKKALFRILIVCAALLSQIYLAMTASFIFSLGVNSFTP